MSSRDQILAAVRRNQPPSTPLPGLSGLGSGAPATVARLTSVLEAVRTPVIPVAGFGALGGLLEKEAAAGTRIVTTIPELAGAAELLAGPGDPHLLETVDLAVLPGHFAVAENGAIWLTEELMVLRALPFICQRLAVVVREVVATMHEAYARIGSSDYGFGAFIAGPSKTADIEQSLVVGAHGPRSMTVYLLQA